MKTNQKIVILLLAFALILGMIPANQVSAAKKVSLSSKKITVTKGKSKTLKVQNTKKKVKWKILSGKKYITLKKKGKVAVSIKGKEKGTAKVQATIGKKKLTCKVTVKNAGKEKNTSKPTETAVPTTPSGTNTTLPVNLTNIPEGAKKQDVMALAELIVEQRKQGGTISEDLDDLWCLWENGRLTEIAWTNHSGVAGDGNVKLKGNINFGGFTALRRLECCGNQLTSLDVSNNSALEELDCDENQLTSLDVSNNSALKMLSCNENQLTSDPSPVAWTRQTKGILSFS